MTVVFYYHPTHFVGEVILEIVMLYTFLEFGIKETVQRDFRPPFFHYSNLHGPLIDGLKYFRFLIKISRSLSNFRLNKTNLPGYDIPRGDVLAGVSYLGELYFGSFFIDSPGYDTPERLTRQGIIPRGY